MCLRVLKESNKSRFDRYSRQKQCIDHIPYYLSGLSRAHFSDNLSRNNCIYHAMASLGDVLHGTFCKLIGLTDNEAWFKISITSAPALSCF